MGQFLEFYSERCTAVNSVFYNENLRGQVKPSIRNKRRRLLPNCVTMLHDNVHPHSAASSN
jgi:hypothetical protein